MELEKDPVQNHSLTCKLTLLLNIQPVHMEIYAARFIWQHSNPPTIHYD